MMGSSYYDQCELWGNPPEPYQVQVQMDILDLLPKDIKNILDIGCGDGYITNALPEQLHVVGIDISKEALNYVKRETKIGSITEIPFSDKFFDLVMANDIIEHIPDGEYQKALNELARVAGKYILITVPYNEQLESNQTKCAECGTIYHVSRHQRSYDEQRLQILFEPRFKPIEMRYSGSLTRPPFDPTIPIRHAFGFYQTWKNAVCPKCGSKRQVAYEDNTLLIRALNAQRHIYWFSKDHYSGEWNNRSEIIVLYSNTTVSYQRRVTKYLERPGSLLDIDFSNPLQIASPDFTPGAVWSKFYLPAGAKLNEDGIRRSSKAPEVLIIPIRLPVKPKTDDRIGVNVSGAGKGDLLSLYSIDGIFGGTDQLFSSTITNTDQYIEIRISKPWQPDQFGFGIEIHLSGQICLHSLQYKPKEGRKITTPFVLLKPGYNVICSGTAGLIRSWGLLVNSGAYYPKPDLEQDWQMAEDHDVKSISLSDVEKIVYNDYLSLLQDYRLLNQQLHETKVQLNEAKFQLNETMAQLNEAMVQLHETRVQLNDRSGIRGGAKEVIRGIKRKLVGSLVDTIEPVFPSPWKPLSPLPKPTEGDLRVLVLSHMFPHPAQPFLGPFIFEQIKALRKYEWIDARVVSGFPYWLLHGDKRSILGALKSCWTFKRYHKKCKWVEIEGVPVLYLPYPIFGRLLNHAWAYRKAIFMALPRIQEGFSFNLIHAHTGFLDGFTGLALSKRVGCPLVITEHTGPFSMLMNHPVKKRMTIKSLLSADVVTAVSHAQKNAISQYVGEEWGSNIQILANGVDTDIFCPQGEWNPDPEAPRILFVGFLVPVKNLELLLNAFAGMLRQIPRAKLILLGSGSNSDPTYERKIRDMVVDLEIEASVEIRPGIPIQNRSDLARVLQEECDIVVLSSHSETFGCALTEAIACGKPVVSTRCGGPEDIITESFLGELCENENTDALREALVNVARRITTYDQNRIRAHTLNTFSYGTIARKLREIYQQTLSARDKI